MNLISRKEALAAGLLRYFTGKPCPRGHIAERFVSVMCCSECTAAAGVAWKKVNVQRVRDTSRAWRKANPEAARAMKAASQKRNRATANARNRKWAAQNREQINARVAAWARANPAKCSASTMRYHASKLHRTPPWADHAAIELVYRRASALREVVGIKAEVDHIIPLRGRLVSGLHVHENLQVITANANKVKANHFQGARL